MDKHATAMDARSGRRDAVRKVGGLGAAVLAALGLVEPAAARRHRGFTTRVVVSNNSAPLSVAAGSTVQASAECGGVGKVISCGYQMSSSASVLVNVLVTTIESNSDRSECGAELTRTAEAGSTAGATIQAVAICRV